MTYGWLTHNPHIIREASWFGIPLRQDPPLPTRWEEFTFVASLLRVFPPGRVLDAACGFEPGVHIMPEIMSSLGWEVEAVDLTEPLEIGAFGEGFPEDPRIRRSLGDITDLKEFEDASMDAYVCVSVFEHLEPHDMVKALREAFRVLKPEGLFVLTMDELDPTCFEGMFSSTFEEIVFEGEDLSPKVSFLTNAQIR